MYHMGFLPSFASIYQSWAHSVFLSVMWLKKFSHFHGWVVLLKVMTRKLANIFPHSYIKQFIFSLHCRFSKNNKGGVEQQQYTWVETVSLLVLVDFT